MITKNYLYFLLIPVIAGVIIMFVTGSFASISTYGQVRSNITSTVCNGDGTCITSICIDNQPCKTFSSNSTSTINNDNSTDNDNGEQQSTGPPEQVI